MSSAVLELGCGRCGVWWMRWTVDLDQPFDEQLRMSATGEPYIDPWVNGRGVVRVNSPGGYYPGSDGWYRWTPGETASLPEGVISHHRREFTCPNGCRSNVQARVNKLDDAAVKVLRHLYDTRRPLLRTTVDKLLALSS